LYEVFVCQKRLLGRYLADIKSDGLLQRRSFYQFVIHTSMSTSPLVQKVWNFCHTLRDAVKKPRGRKVKEVA
jgi:hypothetical protein